MTTIGPIVFVIAVVVIFQMINPFFLKYQGFISLIYSMSYFLVAACGLTFVIITGSFDFSVPSLLKLSALLCVLYIEDIGLWVIPLALLVCVGFGFINGLFLAKFNVPSFMATLGVSIVVEGIARYLSKGFLQIMDDKAFRSLSTTFIVGLPSVFYWGLGIWLISIFLAMCTPFGRRTYAVGGNLIGAGLSGMNVARHRIYVFMLSGFLSGLAGVLYMAQMGGRFRGDGSRYGHTAFRKRGCGRHGPHGRRGRTAQDLAGSDYYYLDSSGNEHARHWPGHPDADVRPHRHRHEHCHTGQEKDNDH